MIAIISTGGAVFVFPPLVEGVFDLGIGSELFWYQDFPGYCFFKVPDQVVADACRKEGWQGINLSRDYIIDLLVFIRKKVDKRDRPVYNWRIGRIIRWFDQGRFLDLDLFMVRIQVMTHLAATREKNIIVVIIINILRNRSYYSHV